MTPPVTPEALVDLDSLRDTLARAIDPHAFVWPAMPARSEAALAKVDALLAPVLSAIQRVTAERDEAREVVARCNNSFGSYSYHLNPHPAEQIEKVKWQARSEWQRAEAATAEAASLRAEVEAKDRRIAALTEALKPFAKAGELFGPRLSDSYDQSIYAPAAGPEYAISADHLRAARTALARAATAREGA